MSSPPADPRKQSRSGLRVWSLQVSGTLVADYRRLKSSVMDRGCLKRELSKAGRLLNFSHGAPRLERRMGWVDGGLRMQASSRPRHGTGRTSPRAAPPPLPHTQGIATRQGLRLGSSLVAPITSWVHEAMADSGRSKWPENASYPTVTDMIGALGSDSQMLLLPPPNHIRGLDTQRILCTMHEMLGIRRKVGDLLIMGYSYMNER